MKPAELLMVAVAASVAVGAAQSHATHAGAPTREAGPAGQEADPGAQGTREETSSPDGLLGLVPADAAVVMWMDFAALTGEGRRFLLPMLPGGAGLDLLELAAATGINAQRDVRQLALALVDGSEEDATSSETPPAHPLLIVRVDYRDTRLLEVLGDKPTSTYGDHTLYRVDVGGLVRTPAGVAEEGTREGDQETGAATPRESDKPERRRARAERRADRRERRPVPGAVALLGEELVLVGTVEGVRSALDVGAGERPSFLDEGKLAEHVRAIPPERNTILAFSGAALDTAVRLYSENNPRSPLATGLLPRLRGVLLSADLETGVEGTLTALLPTEQDAKMLADSLVGLLALWKMSLQREDPELLAVVDRSMGVEHRAERVDVEVSVTPEDSLLLQAFLVKRFGTWFEQSGELGDGPEDTERD